ncbi:MAG: Lipoamide acyltransferase component of branched-chain alpha-keto aciddehydrogenase complex [Candidatus Giovannonibacteria bacterium GW2011_GWA2_44_13b]|uniref:Lipoamide acyltransferase component of branched-chain alpha-keto aciddehydrogenase complex n=2 Tax=Candidatus Giovannoniibacteriota TaxID=1752738 RepID=A0A0G1H6K2_9BACT|nr:MAG: Lipoamide acyltransferase component of branched-chain alpha-keto aciddehydrogenase complex [Candidatus Giovannonibacteria bacterium GW2011_GWA2_44_13b]
MAGFYFCQIHASMLTDKKCALKELKVSQLRKAVARNLTEGKKIPWSSCKLSVDATTINFYIKHRGLKIDAIFLSAMAELIYCKMPQMNVRWADGEKDPATQKETGPKIFLFNELNFGLAMESKNGLTVVTIRDVEHKNVWRLNAKIKELASIATEGKLRPQHFEPKPNIVFNNIGIYPNITDGDPLLVPGNTFMISAFRIMDTHVIYKGYTFIRPMMNVKITFDHRPLDGKDPAMFLNLLKEYIENFK